MNGTNATQNDATRANRDDADRRIEELARNSSEDAFNVVQDLMTGAETERTRLAAALAILEGRRRKPRQTLTTTAAQRRQPVRNAGCSQSSPAAP